MHVMIKTNISIYEKENFIAFQRYKKSGFSLAWPPQSLPGAQSLNEENVIFHLRAWINFFDFFALFMLALRTMRGSSPRSGSFLKFTVNPLLISALNFLLSPLPSLRIQMLL